MYKLQEHLKVKSPEYRVDNPQQIVAVSEMLESTGAAPRPPHPHPTHGDMPIHTQRANSLVFFFSFSDSGRFTPIRLRFRPKSAEIIQNQPKLAEKLNKIHVKKKIKIKT